MDKQWRSTGLFAAGALAGGVLALAGYLGWMDSKPLATQENASPVAMAPAMPSPQPVSQSAAAANPVQAVALASSCPSQPLAASGADGDGQFALEPALAAGTRSEPQAYLAVAREAAGQGRLRDAEVALLAACHVTEEAAGRDSAPLADVKSQLGQHYVMLASREEGEEARDGLLQRASLLFADSANAYASALGRNASKTRMAEQRLASVRSPETLRAALRPQPPATSVLGAAQVPERIAPAPQLIRTDPELAQLESDLQRLQAQAASVSRDQAGVQRRGAQAVARRDAQCHDRACLLQWYAQRRAQLLDEF